LTKQPKENVMLQGSRMVWVLIGFGLLSAPAWSQSREEKFRTWDTDGDGAINMAEHRAVMQDTFRGIDADANGNLSIEEMYDSLVQEQQRTGITTIPEAVHAVAAATIQSYDRNGNRSASLAEFIAAQDVYFAKADRDRDARMTWVEMQAGAALPVGQSRP
jgi:Ca2+-binding EF-hand superfamily protein